MKSVRRRWRPGGGLMAGAVAAAPPSLVLEDGTSVILLESGDRLLLE